MAIRIDVSGELARAEDLERARADLRRMQRERSYLGMPVRKAVAVAVAAATIGAAIGIAVPAPCERAACAESLR